MYRNSRMCIKSDAWSATTTWKHKSRKNTVPVVSHTTECLHSIQSSYDKINKEHSHAPNHKIRSFLLKTDRDTHRLKDWWQCRSSHQQAYHYYDVMYQNSNQGHSEEKHERSKKKDKNSYIGYYCICINTDVFIQTLRNLWCSSRKTIKYVQYPSKILRTFGYWTFAIDKHM